MKIIESEENTYRLHKSPFKKFISPPIKHKVVENDQHSITISIKINLSPVKPKFEESLSTKVTVPKFQ